MIFGWLHRLFTPAEPPAPRLSARVTALENLCDDLDARVDYLTAEIKKVRGRQFSLEKRAKDAPEEANGEEPTQEPPPPQITSTAHLARRLRSW